MGAVTKSRQLPYSRTVRSILTLTVTVMLGGCSTGKAILDAEQHRPVAEHLVPTKADAPIDWSCTGAKRIANAAPTKPTKAVRSLEDFDPILGPGDVVKLFVPQDDNLTGRYAVGLNGKITLPYTGPVNARGLTVSRLQNAVRRKFASQGILSDAGIPISIVPVRWAPAHVTVSGAVFQKGRAIINEPKKDVDQSAELETVGDASSDRLIEAALRAAAGVRPDADLNNVILQRQGKRYTISLAGVVTGAPVRSIPLMDGDAVYVPSTGCFQPELIRPSLITPRGMRVFMSNLTRSALHNNASAIDRYATNLPYGTRLLEASISSNCVGGAEATNAGRSVVLISRNPMSGKTEVIERDIAELMTGVNDHRVNPYMMPGDALACFDSAVTNAREVALTFSELITPIHTLF
jgi:protein involved in polysaccharide export with SLBB domain